MAAEGGARAEILRRIRAANGRATSVAEAEVAWSGISRPYSRSSARSEAEVLDLLEDRLHDYDAHVLRTERAHVAEAVAERLRSRGAPRMIMPAGVPGDLLPPAFEIAVDEGFDAAQLNLFDGVLTTAQVAIAETGTLVLQGVPGQGRRAVSLVPDYHLCLLSRADVVATVPEAMERLQPMASLPTTFISGPSATADIEMTRIKGVHGPRFLDVILFF